MFRVPTISYIALGFFMLTFHGHAEEALSVIAHKIVIGARKEVQKKTKYKETYERLSFPNGDVNRDNGVCSDLIIRAFRNANIDLQKLLHEDRVAHPKAYPTHIWKYKKPDRNIDHRRCQNLIVFFQRHSKKINKEKPSQRKPGDVIFFVRDGKKYPWHVGIVSDVGKQTKMYHVFPPIASEDKIADYGPIKGVFRWEKKKKEKVEKK